jgi:hypothetical protein
MGRLIMLQHYPLDMRFVIVVRMTMSRNMGGAPLRYCLPKYGN